jgi:hypothetical protein
MHNHGLLCDYNYRHALRVFANFATTILEKHAGIGNHATQQNVIMHAVYWPPIIEC